VQSWGQELTEEQALQLLAASPRARELRAGVDVTRAETRAWSRPANPIANYTREGTDGTHFLQLQQVIPLSGRLGLRRRAGEAAVDAVAAESEAALFHIRSEFRAAFHALMFAQEREATVLRSLGTLEEIIAVLRLREREGEGSAFDRMRAERELAEFQAELTVSQVVVERSRARLASYLPSGRDDFKAVGDIRAISSRGRSKCARSCRPSATSPAGTNSSAGLPSVCASRNRRSPQD
jgi:outer membrane protein TolC